MTDPYAHIEIQIQGYRNMQSLAYDEIDVHTLLGQVADTMTDMLAVVRALERDVYSYNLPRSVQDALAKLEHDRHQT